MVTQDFLDGLICMDKKILKAEKKRMYREHRHYRNNFELRSCEGGHLFRAFLRYSVKDAEDFSIGLTWTKTIPFIHANKPVVLLRCQGPHDGADKFMADVHNSYHVHKSTAKDVNDCRYLKPSNRSPTSAFSSFQSALAYFAKKCSITNATEYIDFALASQLTLADIGGMFHD